MRARCHLCHIAHATLLDAQHETPFSLTLVDIDSDEALREEHWADIPVVEINGQKAFKYRMSKDEFLQQLAEIRAHS